MAGTAADDQKKRLPRKNPGSPSGSSGFWLGPGGEGTSEREQERDATGPIDLARVEALDTQRAVATLDDSREAERSLPHFDRARQSGAQELRICVELGDRIRKRGSPDYFATARHDPSLRRETRFDQRRAQYGIALAPCLDVGLDGGLDRVRHGLIISRIALRRAWQF